MRDRENEHDTELVVLDDLSTIGVSGRDLPPSWESAGDRLIPLLLPPLPALFGTIKNHQELRGET